MTGSNLDDLVGDVVEDTPSGQLTYEQYTLLRDALTSEDLDPLFDEQTTSFFILGKYDDGPMEERLTTVRDRINRDSDHAFLMKEIDDQPFPFWTTQFKVLAKRADYIVGVYENDDGGHAWEAGYLSHPGTRSRVRALKRDYPDLEGPDEPFSGMFAHFIQVLDGIDQAYHWEGKTDASTIVLEQNLLEAVNNLLADTEEDQ